MSQYHVQLVRRHPPVPWINDGRGTGCNKIGLFRTLCAFILITLAFGPQASGQGEKAEKLKDAITNAVATQAMLSTLTTDTVPEKWRTKVEDKSRDNLAIKVFSRGNDRVLQVLWRKDWAGSRSNMFSATVYDGQTQIGKITGLPGEAVISQPKKARLDYDMATVIKDDGRVSVMFSNDSGYLQVIEVKGRETRLMDDIEYTKMAVGIGQIMPPLWEAIEELRTQPKKASRRGETNQ